MTVLVIPCLLATGPSVLKFRMDFSFTVLTIH